MVGFKWTWTRKPGQTKCLGGCLSVKAAAFNNTAHYYRYFKISIMATQAAKKQKLCILQGSE